MSLRFTLLFAICMVVQPTATHFAAMHADRRVVDAVQAGDARSEEDHGYAGHDAERGVANGRPFRQARGWMRYALTTFDDTDVTLECTFSDEATAGGNAQRRYDVIVEDSLVATRTFLSAAAGSAGSPAALVVEIRVPFAVTKGRTHIAVTIRGVNGPTPALHVLRVLQDHNEVDYPTFFPTAR